jgi:hypothetical protein
MTQQQCEDAKAAAQAFIDSCDACIGEFVRGRTPTPQEVANAETKWNELVAKADEMLE